MDELEEGKLAQDVTELKTDMKWVKKMLSNHYQHHEKLIFWLILGLSGAIGSLFLLILKTGY